MVKRSNKDFDTSFLGIEIEMLKRSNCNYRVYVIS